MRRIFVLVLLLGFTVPRAEGTALRVPLEYPTINAALDAAHSGDSVLVAPGIYSDYEVRVLHGGGTATASSVAFLKGGVSLIGEGGRDATRIDLAGQGVGFAVPVLAYEAVPGTVSVQGLTITGAPAGNAGVWCRFMDRMVIRACRLSDVDGAAASPGGVYSETVDLEIYDTEFLDCRAEGVPYGQAAILHVEGDALLAGCRFVGCHGRLIADLNALGVSPPFDAAVYGCEFRSNVGLAAQLTSFINLTVEDCSFIGNSNPGGVYAALIVSGGGGGINEPGPYVVRRNLFAGNTPRAVTWDRVTGSIEENTFTDNGERALTLHGEAQHVVIIERNIVAFTNGIGILRAVAPPPITGCNAFWINTGGNTAGFPLGPTDFVADPQFCDRENGDYTLMGSSPCLPPNSGDCGQVGAFGQGCGSVSVEAETWAKTKAKYWSDSTRRQEP